jgi:hypothetical protein
VAAIAAKTNDATTKAPIASLDAAAITKRPATTYASEI